MARPSRSERHARHPPVTKNRPPSPCGPRFRARGANEGPHSWDEAIEALAERQHGIVSLARLLALGLTRRAIAGRSRPGRLMPLHRCVYAVGHTALTARSRDMAAVLACGPGALLSHRSAAHSWQLLPSSSARIEVTPHDRCGSHTRGPGRGGERAPARRRGERGGGAAALRSRFGRGHPRAPARRRDGIACGASLPLTAPTRASPEAGPSVSSSAFAPPTPCPGRAPASPSPDTRSTPTGPTRGSPSSSTARPSTAPPGPSTTTAGATVASRRWASR